MTVSPTATVRRALPFCWCFRCRSFQPSAVTLRSVLLLRYIIYFMSHWDLFEQVPLDTDQNVQFEGFPAACTLVGIPSQHGTCTSNFSGGVIILSRIALTPPGWDRRLFRSHASMHTWCVSGG